VGHPSIQQQITFFYTSDLARTAAFYEDVLGLPVSLDQGDCRVYRLTPNAYVGFCQRCEVGQATAVLLTIVTDEVDAWYQRLAARGITFDAPPRINPRYNLYHCFCTDPNGYRIEIQQFIDANWDAAPPEQG
jgi:catechol 2,3-dioxygenase-like lactoylglutathione lyase family enzyme